MSNQEKATHLKKCLTTIGVECPELSRYMERSLEIERKQKNNLSKLLATDRKLENLQAEIMALLLRS